MIEVGRAAEGATRFESPGSSFLWIYIQQTARCRRDAWNVEGAAPWKLPKDRSWSIGTDG
jgi:hypothetical protein